jgi:hypothetical protein
VNALVLWFCRRRVALWKRLADVCERRLVAAYDHLVDQETRR